MHESAFQILVNALLANNFVLAMFLGLCPFLGVSGRLDTAFGKATRGELVVGLPGEQLLDSLAVDGEGHVCVATIRNGGITDIDPADGSSVHVPTGDPLTTNICCGGPDLRTAYITCSRSGRLVKTTWPRPGLKLNFNP